MFFYEILNGNTGAYTYDLDSSLRGTNVLKVPSSSWAGGLHTKLDFRKGWKWVPRVLRLTHNVTCSPSYRFWAVSYLGWSVVSRYKAKFPDTLSIMSSFPRGNQKLYIHVKCITTFSQTKFIVCKLIYSTI